MKKLNNGATLIWFRTEEEAKFASRRLLPLAVEEFCAHLGYESKEVCFDADGKPHFASFPPYHLSVTHTADLIVFAFAPFPIGVDAEKTEEDRPAVAKRYFSKEERALPFSHVWTGKEAVGKLTGKGLSHALKTEVSQNEACFSGKKYLLHREELEEGKFLVTLAYSPL